MKEKPDVMISSTTRDLPEYRAQVMDACLRVGMFPQMMEHLPALDADAIRASLDLVEEADVYVGIFAHRYGYVPDGHDISVTQMEYERAVERGIPRLIFLMHDDVPVLPKDFDKGEAAEKLEKLKSRLMKERVLEFFKNPEDLRGLVVHSLGEIKKQLDAGRTDQTGPPISAEIAKSLHHVSEIPQPPEPYIAHPYTLLRVRRLIGRENELDLLTARMTGRAPFREIRIFSIVGIGGMGKSALTWTWFNDFAPQEMRPLAGRMWWSFYESDATFENFVTRALAYASRRPLNEVKRLTLPRREAQLLSILQRDPFLLVLDGLERILTAYARLDAPYQRDEEAFDKESGNHVAGTIGLLQSGTQSHANKRRLRMTADPRAATFLQNLARTGASRVLINTRLYPADLEGPMGSPLPGCDALTLNGLSDDDSLKLWLAYGAKGSREEMLPIFRSFDRHPLLIQLLAYEVAGFHEAPGEFDAWKAANPDFNPFGLELANVQSHVLAYAMRGLSAAELRTLYIIASFRMPTSMGTIKALLIRSGPDEDHLSKPFATLNELDAALTTLEGRGLLGWDRDANRYDLHPIVRGVVWTALGDVERMDLCGTLRTHFEAMPVPNYLDVQSLDDVAPAIELFNTLVRLEMYDAAFQVFQERLDEATHFRLSANRLRVELLEALFPNGLDGQPVLSPANLSSTLNSLSLAYSLSGRPGTSISLLKRADEIDARENDHKERSIGLGNLADAYRLSGKLRSAETSARKALELTRREGARILEGASLSHIGLVSIARGELDTATTAFRRSLRIWKQQGIWQSEGWINAYLAEVALRRGNADAAKKLAGRARQVAAAATDQRELIQSIRLQGTAALFLREYVMAAEWLDDALIRARAISLIEEELPSLVTLAEWHRQQDEGSQAEATLADVWEAAEEGPYPLFHADALNVLAQIHRDAKRRDAAHAAATQAYLLAWCDGPPFTYHWGLEKAKAHLTALGAPEPKMPPFDESEHEPMPEVEINPPDEFGGDASDDEA
jgi:tetratricopeptide (TPR) repeat protein